MNPRVKYVMPEKNYILRITFYNGKIKYFNMKPYLDFGIFCELKNIKYFKQVKAINGTIAWPHGQDVCPDTLYEESA